MHDILILAEESAECCEAQLMWRQSTSLVRQQCEVLKEEMQR